MNNSKPNPEFSLEDFISSVAKATTLVGLDIGKKTIGVAVSDTLWLTATPLKTIFRKSFNYDMNELANLLKGREIGAFIAGLPLQMNAEEGQQARYTREQALEIAGFYQKPVFFQDERFSSACTERIMIEAYDMSRKKRKEKLDAGAAATILQTFLDKIRYQSS